MKNVSEKSMKSNNFGVVHRGTLEDLIGDGRDRLQLIEAYISFAKLGPFDFRTGADSIHKACSEAILRLLPVALSDTGQSGVIAKFLLGIYKGSRFPFDITEMRRLDHEIFLDCMAVLMGDSIGGKEVHIYFEKNAKIWKHLVEYWGLEEKK